MLFLHSPLLFTKTDSLPESMTENDEYLLCYELDPVQSRSIEPDPELLLGALIFNGIKTDNTHETEVSLPAGKYLFVQERSSQFNKSDWLSMAVEQQKDGLWERYTPESRLYVRFLFEDGKYVTQLFRPIELMIEL